MAGVEISVFRPRFAALLRACVVLISVLFSAGNHAATQSHTSSGEPNLWFRIWQESRLADQQHEKIDQWERRLRKRPRDIEIISERAESYLAYIYQEVAKRGMPVEIALLPAIESGFDPFAYSQGRASGLWQFIPGTADYLGLESNWWYDGRRDLITSTDAALNYLEKLHRRFDDWLLAVAAYNGGQGRINKLIRKNRKKGRDTDFWSLPLTGETANYVPRWLAMTRLMTHPSKMESVIIAPLERYLPFARSEIPGQIDLALASELCDCSIKRLYQLNPGLSRWATAPEGPHHLLVPVEKRERFTQRLKTVDRNKLVRWKLHEIQNGETLSHIANRYQTTTKVLRASNQLQSDRIRAGAKLLIPSPSGGNSHYALSANERRKRVQAVRRGKLRVTHSVKKGDTLWDLAKKYRTSSAAIARWNGFAPGDPLRLGQKLTIWKKTDNAQQSRVVFYVVRAGDTLSGIAQRFQVSVNEIRGWNSIPSKPHIYPGDRLRIVVDVLNQFSET